MILISLFAGVLLLVNIRRKGWALPVIILALWGLVAIIAGGIYPAFVQRFQVEPAELAKERPFVERNIAATRNALGLDGRRADRLRLRARPDRGDGRRPSPRTWRTPDCSTRPSSSRRSRSSRSSASTTRSATSTWTATTSTTCSTPAGHHRLARAQPGRGVEPLVGEAAPGLHPRVRGRAGAVERRERPW